MRWLPIPGFPDYEVSERGDVRRLTPGKGTFPGRPVKQTVHARDGYMQVSLCRGGRGVTTFTHRHVARAFIGPRPYAKADVAHFDGIKSNNSVSNLRWASRSENHLDKRRHGTSTAFDRHPNAKLSTIWVLGIRLAVADGGLTRRQIGKIYGTSAINVGRIIRNERWAF